VPQKEIMFTSECSGGSITALQFEFESTRFGYEILCSLQRKFGWDWGLATRWMSGMYGRSCTNVGAPPDDIPKRSCAKVGGSMEAIGPVVLKSGSGPIARSGDWPAPWIASVSFQKSQQWFIGKRGGLPQPVFCARTAGQSQRRGRETADQLDRRL